MLCYNQRFSYLSSLIIQGNIRNTSHSNEKDIRSIILKASSWHYWSIQLKTSNRSRNKSLGPCLNWIWQHCFCGCLFPAFPSQLCWEGILGPGEHSISEPSSELHLYKRGVWNKNNSKKGRNQGQVHTINLT